MTSRFRHVLCLDCYRRLEPGRVPVLLRDPEPEVCCRCGQITPAPVYYRAEPDAFRCRGSHEPD